MKKIAIIVAGGKSTRFNNFLPKQFHLINNKPLLYYSILQFSKICSSKDIYVVIPQDFHEYWIELTEKYNIPEHNVVFGGKERFHSVKNGLNVIDNFDSSDIVAIHDGARPFVSKELILRGYEIASEQNSAIPVIKIVDTIRKVENDTSIQLDRNKLKIVQTPQFFNLSSLKKAYETEFLEKFTDDASVFENANNSIFLFEGEEHNIKITTPFHMTIAKIMIENKIIDYEQF